MCDRCAIEPTTSRASHNTSDVSDDTVPFSSTSSAPFWEGKGSRQRERRMSSTTRRGDDDFESVTTRRPTKAATAEPWSAHESRDHRDKPRQPSSQPSSARPRKPMPLHTKPRQPSRGRPTKAATAEIHDRCTKAATAEPWSAVKAATAELSTIERPAEEICDRWAIEPAPRKSVTDGPSSPLPVAPGIKRWSQVYHS